MPSSRELPTIGKRLVSTAHAAQQLDVDPVTIRRAIANGQIQGWRVGRNIRVDLDEVQRVLIVPIPAAPRVRKAASA